MPDTPSPAFSEQPSPLPKLAWNDPCLILEGVLEAQAQGGPPNDRPGPRATDGFLGPLGMSGGQRYLLMIACCHNGWLLNCGDCS